jgi:hypothetical protein
MDYSDNCPGVCHFRALETNCKCREFTPYFKEEEEKEFNKQPQT